MFGYEPIREHDETVIVRTLPAALLVYTDQQGMPVSISLDFDETTTFRTMEYMTRPWKL